jgi:hypothetical protein
MGRSVGLDRTLRARLVVVAGPGSWASGTMVEDCVHVLFHKTPKEEEGVQVTPHKVDASRVAKHTKLELRLLPDGLTVLGFFLVQSDNFLVANNGTCA